MNIPKRRKKPLMGLRESSVISCPGHLKWVRGHECCVAGRRLHVELPPEQPGVLGYVLPVHVCGGRMEAHHSTTRGAGGGDETAVPLCSDAHKRGHDRGWKTFEKEYRVDLSSIAEQLWKVSPHGAKYRREHDER